MTSTNPSNRLAAPRSWLFVPGDRPERFDKAVASGCDAVILDLEDAVAAANKTVATEHIAQWLAAHTVQAGVSIWVRVPSTDDSPAAVHALGEHACLAGFVLPKVETAAQASQWHKPVVAQIETAIGIARVMQIAQDAPTQMIGLAVGVEDLALSLQCQSDFAGMRHACAQTVLAARAFGRYVYACPGSIAQFRDSAAWQATLDHGKGLGSDGALCIHPAQVGPVNNTFSPDAAQVVQAKKIVAAFDEAMHAGLAAVQLDGKMLDAPIVAQARALLARAAQFNLT